MKWLYYTILPLFGLTSGVLAGIYGANNAFSFSNLSKNFQWFLSDTFSTIFIIVGASIGFSIGLICAYIINVNLWDRYDWYLIILMYIVTIFTPIILTYIVIKAFGALITFSLFAFTGLVILIIIIILIIFWFFKILFS